jgi:hypothetical protein
VPHRRSITEETRSTTLGGEAVGIHHASADEATYCSGENELITRAVHSPETGYFHLDKNHGGYIETLASAG